MTTKVTIDAHAGWPVSVTIQDKKEDGVWGTTDMMVVPANETRDTYVTQSRRVIVEEGERK